MTQWDIYETEVVSGHLRWSVVHDTDFFRKNVRKFEGSDGKFTLVQVCDFFFNL
jgi:V-ATPase subunit H